jgi:NAD(P)-dependent dehydrogenase (short-subunit alcohol dehydrogenase family)
MRLKNKVAIITGAAHGMGEAEARLFGAEGAKVIVADILESDAEIVAADKMYTRPARRGTRRPADRAIGARRCRIAGPG